MLNYIIVVQNKDKSCRKKKKINKSLILLKQSFYIVVILSFCEILILKF